MNNIVTVQNQKRVKASRFMLIFGVLLVLFAFQAFQNGKMFSTIKEENLITYEGKLNTFKVNENKDTKIKTYLITIETSTHEAVSLETNIETKSFERKSLEESIDVTSLANGTKKYDIKITLLYNKKDLVRASLDGTSLYDFVPQLKSSIIRTLVIFSILAALMLAGFIVYLVKFIKSPKQIEMDYVEFVLTGGNYTTNRMLDDKCKTMKRVKFAKILNYILIGILVIIFFVTMFVMKDKSNLVLGIFILIIAGVVLAMVLLRPKFYTKELDQYIDDYMDYLENSKNEKIFKHFFSFNKEGLKLTNEKDTYFFDYHELKLYTTVVYAKNDSPVSFFICSSKIEKEEFKDVNSFIIPVSHDVYTEIKENGIYIDGFDEVMDNIKKEAKEQFKTQKTTYAIKKYS